MLYRIGVDVAKRAHVAAVISPEGRLVLSGFKFSNSLEGFSSLLNRLAEVGATAGRTQGVCLEATGHYGRNLIMFLQAHGFRVFEVNPLLTSSWRRAATVRKVKNDRVDAEALARWLANGGRAIEKDPATLSNDLRNLTRSRAFLSHVLGDCKRKAQAVIDMVFPEFHKFFSDDFGDTACAVLKTYGSAEALSRARVDAIERTMRKAGGRRFTRERAQRLKDLARASVGQSSRFLELSLKMLVEQIEFTGKQIRAIDKEAYALIRDSPIFTIPGIGPATGAAILGELGDVTRFSSAKKIYAFAGCDPSICESGEFKGRRAHMSKRGSKYLRWVLWLAADRARIFDPVLRAYYNKKRGENKTHKVAINAVIRKLCAIIFAVLRDNKPYVCPLAG